MTPARPTFGQLLTQAQEETGIKNNWLAKETGHHPTSISRWKNPKYKAVPSLDERRVFERAMKVPVGYFEGAVPNVDWGDVRLALAGATGRYDRPSGPEVAPEWQQVRALILEQLGSYRTREALVPVRQVEVWLDLAERAVLAISAGAGAEAKLTALEALEAQRAPAPAPAASRPHGRRPFRRPSASYRGLG